MRCKNCGWENPDQNQKCEKCNAPLMGSMIENNISGRKSEPIADVLRGTVPENGKHLNTGNDLDPSENTNCSACGYIISDKMNVCPNCGNDIGKSKVKISPEQKTKTCPKCGNSVSPTMKFCSSCGSSLKMGTVNAWESPQQGNFCTLKPIPWKGEEVTYNPITYSGKLIILNRANTDPNNNTITSKEQAVLICEGNEWYIEDKSEQQTTFIRAGKKIKLENGDIVVLGNRLFEFKG
ncbi:zinc-ribbon domain-containing protein [Bacteroides sp. 519]|uniref:double zinc ribbon domain-containing protein n=1 Tax=Bacteroides sp. 519 TaxID=2302937 RepID=UPI0013D1896A|nr:zinc-ribbon domain-containing protein [Bacteroides sp. 519]NDV57875.1 zinc-ribbon domain-containing protein [Bacteroides sp. 519]